MEVSDEKGLGQYSVTRGSNQYECNTNFGYSTLAESGPLHYGIQLPTAGSNQCSNHYIWKSMTKNPETHQH